MRRSSTTTMLVAVAAISLLTACGSSASDADPGPASGVSAAKLPSSSSPQSARNRGPWDLVLRDVRVGKHDGFDRVVVEFEGTGTPGWSAKYVARARADGSGKVVRLRGDSSLSVSISGVTIRKGYPRTPADFFHGRRHFAPKDGGVIEDVDALGVFEGYSQLFLGIDGDKVPFRVFALTSPSRLVVDVRDS